MFSVMKYNEDIVQSVFTKLLHYNLNIVMESVHMFLCWYCFVLLCTTYSFTLCSCFIDSSVLQHSLRPRKSQKWSHIPSFSIGQPNHRPLGLHHPQSPSASSALGQDMQDRKIQTHAGEGPQHSSSHVSVKPSWRWQFAEILRGNSGNCWLMISKTVGKIMEWLLTKVIK